MKLVGKSLFIPAPAPGVLVHANSFYVRRGGCEKMRTCALETRSDLLDSIARSFSSDNGRTWSAWETLPCVAPVAGGTRRTTPLPGFVDPAHDRLLTLVLEGVLPDDDPLQGMAAYCLRCEVSLDGGKTPVTSEPVAEAGHTPEHPFAGVWVGKNAIMVGDVTCRPLRTRAGTLLAPVQTTVLDDAGRLHNPGGGLTWTEAAVLIGRWGDGMKMEWELSQRVSISPELSTRGLIEPTIAEMPDGRLLMIMRGSNDARPELPGRKWRSVSTDGGRHWSEPEPWAYDDGTLFFSPSACSQLLEHSNGGYYWLGNITADNPRGNGPRYPLVVGEVTPDSMALVRKSLLVVDDRQSGEDSGVTLSNFMAHDDRETGEIVVHMSRFFPAAWAGDAFIYRIAP